LHPPLVELGKSKFIDTDLKDQKEMHDYFLPPKGFHSICAKGRSDSKSGMGVMHNEYVFFHRFQVLPMYVVEYNYG